jgi:dTDP-4-amino-4,6-dideoxygalactose transaminase
MTSERPYIPIAKPLIGDEEKRAVLEVLDSGQLAQGPRTEAFEQAFAAYIGTRHAIAVNSGTAALIVALQAHGIGPGDEVITTPFSFIATATSILAVGATPVFVDIDPFDFNIDPALIEGAVTDETKAIMPVHLYGGPARIEELAEIAADFELPLIEDAAQAHGAESGGRRLGSFGTGCFSFYPTKNMTTGEGGIITTNDDAIAEQCRLIRHHGQSRRYYHDVYGLNYRLTDIAAAIGHEQLKKLESWNHRRIANATALSQWITALETPRVREGDRHVFHQYTVRIKGDRDAVQARLHEMGVGSAVHYPIPIHQQPVIRQLGLAEDTSCPIAEAAANSVLSIPVHPALTEDDLVRVAEAVNAAAAE